MIYFLFLDLELGFSIILYISVTNSYIIWLDIILFFFYINNLLHGVWRQTVVATFVTTYRGSILTGKLKEKEKKKRYKS